METFSSLVTLLRHRAVTQPDDRAYIFLSDRGAEEATLTFRELWTAAYALASRLFFLTTESRLPTSPKRPNIGVRISAGGR